MGPPRHLGTGGSSSGYGPFGQKAFRFALIGCVALVAVGLAMVLLGGAAPRSVGTSFIVLGVLGLTTGAAGLLAERVLRRRQPPPPDVRAGNGQGAYTPERSRSEAHKRGRR